MELYAKPKIGKLETHKPDTLVECARVGKQENNTEILGGFQVLSNKQ